MLFHHVPDSLMPKQNWVDVYTSFFDNIFYTKCSLWTRNIMDTTTFSPNNSKTHILYTCFCHSFWHSSQPTVGSNNAFFLALGPDSITLLGSSLFILAEANPNKNLSQTETSTFQFIQEWTSGLTASSLQAAHNMYKALSTAVGQKRGAMHCMAVVFETWLISNPTTPPSPAETGWNMCIQWK